MFLLISGCSAGGGPHPGTAPRTSGAASGPVRPTALTFTDNPVPPVVLRTGEGVTDRLTVRCLTGGAIQVDGARVAAGAAGVTLWVSSEAPAGTVLVYSWPEGGRTSGANGNTAPRTATTWQVPVPPGPMSLTCHRSGGTSSSVDITVTDPRHVWRSASLTDVGCRPGATPPKTLAPVGQGATPRAAAESVVEALQRLPAGTRPSGRLATVRAPIGYPAASDQVWLVTVDGRPYLSLRVSPMDVVPGLDLVLASPDHLCTH